MCFAPILLYNDSMKKKIVTATNVLVLSLAVVALGFTIYNLSNTVGELRTEIGRSEADAILASAEIDNDMLASMPVLYYDQVADECVDMYDISLKNAAANRQFEWTKCNYYHREVEPGIVDFNLGADYLPVAVGGNLLSNRGVSGENFKRWFSGVDGKSKVYGSTLGLKYDAANAMFSYENYEFYPLNEMSLPNESVNQDGNNHLFTMNLGAPVRLLVDGNEEFEVVADDDTWVFVDNMLVLDMGGVHAPATGRFVIHNDGEIYSSVDEQDLAYSGVKVYKNENTVIRVFHADRDSESSVFKLAFKNILLNITKDAKIANGDGLEVAYDPQNPSYIAPLGESLSIRPNRSDMVLKSAIAEATIMGMILVVIVAIISVVWKYSHHDRNLE